MELAERDEMAGRAFQRNAHEQQSAHLFDRRLVRSHSLSVPDLLLGLEVRPRHPDRHRLREPGALFEQLVGAATSEREHLVLECERSPRRRQLVAPGARRRPRQVVAPCVIGEREPRRRSEPAVRTLAHFVRTLGGETRDLGSPALAGVALRRLHQGPPVPATTSIGVDEEVTTRRVQVVPRREVHARDRNERAVQLPGEQVDWRDFVQRASSPFCGLPAPPGAAITVQFSSLEDVEPLREVIVV